ncbi:pilus assembly protein [Hyalangium sp.]|uniref:pilus assembly protein n=1 Tax=Hyalangium sp. TaxID=2028555 RepID=UPI002D6840CD|nr:pilus assembly protein [Hyalangium sp.]HYH99807.1 pilus assembly protein [Hyalangium sp.]
MKMSAAARGQTLVLFALTMLLTSLLVLMTLALSTRVKEKMELQAVADAAAYSNAAITARAYNEIALMSRAQIGKMVSMAAVQSLISWSSFYVAQVKASQDSYKKARKIYDDIEKPCCKPKSPCKFMCSCAKKAIADINLSMAKLGMYHSTLMSTFLSQDTAAANQTKNLQYAASGIFAFQTLRWTKLQDELDDQDLVQKLVSKARAGSATPSEWSAPDSGDDVSKDEALVLGAILPLNYFRDHHVYAAMGSRGFSFVTQRNGGAKAIVSRLVTQLTPPDTVRVSNRGSAYFARSMDHGSLLGASSKFSWAEDHSVSGPANRITFMRGMPPCPPTSSGDTNVQAQLKSTDGFDNSDVHTFSPGGMAEPPARHTLGPCTDCPGIWPTFVDYNPLKLLSSSDLEGQPKNHAVIQRDYSERERSLADLRQSYPWTRFFQFRFTGTSASARSQFDNRGVQLGPQNGNLSIARQTALSTGIAYYHRYGDWKEPPNLLNPYWRATLVPFDVDAEGKDDVRGTLSDVGVDWAADAFRALDANGYKGGP